MDFLIPKNSSISSIKFVIVYTFPQGIVRGKLDQLRRCFEVRYLQPKYSASFMILFFIFQVILLIFFPCMSGTICSWKGPYTWSAEQHDRNFVWLVCIFIQQMFLQVYLYLFQRSSKCECLQIFLHNFQFNPPPSYLTLWAVLVILV